MLSRIFSRKTVLALFSASLFAVVLCYGCAPQQAQPSTQATATESADGATSDENMSVTVTWSPDVDCTTCHDTEGGTYDAIPCVASGEATSCMACHTDEAALSEVHEGVTTDDKMPKKLKKTSLPMDVCESCHGEYESLASLTEQVTVLTDSNGTTVNPHALPENEKHETIMCGDCHQMHSGEDVTTTAPKACANCHHAGVYECNTCHEAE